MQLNELKEHLKVDGNEEDACIIAMQLAAEEFMACAGIVKDYTRSLYSLAIKMMVLHWYENREVVGSADKLAFSLTNIIWKLKY